MRFVRRSICVVMMLAACSANDKAAEQTVRVQAQAISNAVPSINDDKYDAVVQISFTAFAPDASCTGTLVAPNLVLTARHCLSNATTGLYTCDPATGEATGGPGGVYTTDRSPTQVYIYTGRYLPWYSDDGGALPLPSAVGAQIIQDGSFSECTHDVAFLLLDRAVPGPIQPVRLAGPPMDGEDFAVVGWGLEGSSTRPFYRRRLDANKATQIGPAQIGMGDGLARTFQSGAAVCKGDSGAPAIASSGAVIGVAVRVETGTGGTSGQCGDPTAYSTYMQLSPAAALFDKAFKLANAEPWLEGQPDPRLAKFGQTCAKDADCRSNACRAGVGGSQTCNEACPKTACPTGFECSGSGAAMLCKAASSTADAGPVVTLGADAEVPGPIADGDAPLAHSSAICTLGRTGVGSGQNRDLPIEVFLSLVMSLAIARRSRRVTPPMSIWGLRVPKTAWRKLP